MDKRHYTPFQFFMQKVTSSRPGSWYFARTLHHIDRIVLKLSHGRKTLTSILGGVPMMVLTHTGAKSGLARNTPLVCIRDVNNSNVLAIIASNWGQDHHPAWYFNLKANPHVTCEIEGCSGTYIAHEASGEEYEKFWQYAGETYIGYPLYKERAKNRRIPIMVLTPEKQN
jgi:deazaflavin-dependent oxidoreductase (nitroreductase family)